MKIYDSSLKNIARIRTEKSGIYNSFTDVLTCVKNLIGVQAQYNQFALLSIFNRTNCSLDDIKNLGDHQTIINAWGQRVTYHIYTIEDWNLINAVFGQRDNWIKRHINQLGIEKEIIFDKISKLDCGHDYLSKEDFKNVFDIEHSKSLLDWGGILIEASFNGMLYGVTCINQDKKYMLNSTPENNIDDTGIKMILMRYFKTYAPATIQDFMHWSGLNQYEFIGVFNEIKENMIILEYAKKDFYIFKDDYDAYLKNTPNHSRKVKLLGKFDPLLVSYKHKEWIIDKKHIPKVWGKGGQIESVILINDRVCGTWRYKIKSNTMNFTIKLFKEMSIYQQKRIENQLKDIAKFYNKKCAEIYYTGSNP